MIFTLFLAVFTGVDIEISETIQKLFRTHGEGSKFKNRLNITAFRKYLEGAIDPSINIKFIEDGYPLYLATDGLGFKPIALCQKSASFANTKREFIKIIEQIIKELESGAIVPSNTPPSYVLNLFCVPKKDSATGLMTKLRVVRHGSFKTANTTSINDWIDQQKCKMPTLPNLKDYVKLLINSKWMALRDLSDAFRQIGLASADVGYIGYTLFGLHFIDKKQPYGIASAAANCQSFAQIIIWIMNNKLLPSHLCRRILVHIDDFVLAANSKKEVSLMENKFDNLCMETNVKISHEKDVTATQKAVLYGFLFDLKKQTVGIPDDKWKRLRDFIQSTIKIGIITGRALEKLCGQIMHWSQLYKPAKSLCYNMIAYLHRHIRIQKHYRTLCWLLPDCVIKDLKFWLKYTDLVKEVPMESIIREPTIQVVGSSDACDFGGGFCIQKFWSYYTFHEKHRHLQIDEKEAHAVIMLLYNLRKELTGKKLILYIDNSVLYWAMVRHWAGERMMPSIYEICATMMEYKICVWFEWIPTDCNVLADTLSRHDELAFWEWINLFNIEVNPEPLKLDYISDYVFESM